MRALMILMLVALAGCAPGNACRSYGFHEGAVEYSQCVQNEVLAAQGRLASRPRW